MTTRATGGAEGLDCVIVGGGLAGLACAHGLVTAGRSVHLVDAEMLAGIPRDPASRGPEE